MTLGEADLTELGVADFAERGGFLFGVGGVICSEGLLTLERLRSVEALKVTI